MSPSRTKLVALPALAILGGCQLLIGLDGGKAQGTGGAGGTSSSSTATASSSSSSASSSSSSSGSGGSGGAGGTTSSSSGTPCDGGTTCSVLGDCPDPPTECVLRTCLAGCCGTSNVANDMPTIAGQTAGDCMQQVCDGNGATKMIVDSTDVPDDSNACTADSCDAAGTAIHAPLAGPCTLAGNAAVCGDPAGAAKGTCVECNVGTDCATLVCAMNKCQPPAAALLLLAGGGPGVMAGAYHGSTWSVAAVAGATTVDTPAVAYVPATGRGVGLVHAATTNALAYTVWDGASGWGMLAPLHADKTQGAAAVVGVGDTAHVVYWDSSFKYWYEAFTAGAWTAAPKALTVGASAQVCSAYSPRGLSLGSTPMIGFTNGTCQGPLNHAYAIDLVSGVGQNADDIGLGPYVDPTSFPDLPPAVIALTGGTADLMAAYDKCPTAPCTASLQVWWTSRTTATATWSAPVQVPSGVITNDPVALAPLPNGGAMLAFRGTNGLLYVSIYAAGAWGTPAQIPGVTVAIASPPAVVRSTTGADVELAYVDSAGGNVHHARYTGTVWSAPASVGPTGGFTRVALGAGP